MLAIGLKNVISRPCVETCGSACGNLGNNYEKGRGTAANPRQAAIFYKKSCDLDEGLGCAKLGILIMQGRGVGKDGRMAQEIFEKGCALGSGSACTQASGLYGLGTDNAREDVDKCRLFAAKACNLNDAVGCNVAGIVYARIDAAKSLAYYRKACRLGYTDACKLL